MAVADDLQDSQARLDAIEQEIISNKLARESLRQAGRELRDAYVAEERKRERLLRQHLTEGEA